jgi:hypothetical protein
MSAENGIGYGEWTMILPNHQEGVNGAISILRQHHSKSRREAIILVLPNFFSSAAPAGV